jgi:hypothetical protein
MHECLELALDVALTVHNVKNRSTGDEVESFFTFLSPRLPGQAFLPFLINGPLHSFQYSIPRTFTPPPWLPLRVRLSPT